MDFTTITSLIGSLGFPIVMCILMFNRMEKQSEQHKEEMNALKAEMSANNKQTTEAINNNTLALQTLVVKLDKGELQ